MQHVLCMDQFVKTELLASIILPDKMASNALAHLDTKAEFANIVKILV